MFHDGDRLDTENHICSIFQMNREKFNYYFFMRIEIKRDYDFHILHVMSGTQGILFPEDVTEIKEEQQSQKEAQNFDNMTDMTPKSRA